MKIQHDWCAISDAELINMLRRRAVEERERSQTYNITWALMEEAADRLEAAQHAAVADVTLVQGIEPDWIEVDGKVVMFTQERG